MALHKAARANPLAFTPGPVTIIVTVIYVALIVPLLVIRHVLPSAPSTDPKGINLTEAWVDLQHLTAGFHPYNSHRNDDVHQWLLTRVNEILEARASDEAHQSAGEERPDVFVFDDNTSNLTFSGGSVASTITLGVYFEGTNIIVYIRGSEDSKDKWWDDPEGEPEGKGGVLVNAHYDSVSTGYGATDDGVGVITCLQLIKYFTTPGHAPRKGLVVLFNNGEEDFLNGARVYSQHPISKFPHTFLNLEGAGAGGRATLFRSSDTEVTRFYERSQYPYGSVLSKDGFRLVRSQTDYVVFEGDLGLRGLDVAFMEPRARYHTDQDDARHTSKDAVWHMLSAAVATTEGLVSDSSNRFDGDAQEPGKVPSGKGSDAVWFDLFGSAFAVFQLHTLFALSVTLLIVGPLTLFVTSVAVSKVNRMYLFSMSVPLDEAGDERVPLYGLRGIFRFIFLFGVPTGVAVGLAYLLTKVNPQIIHSSEYAVWSMIISAWFFLAWFVSRAADFARPSALHRVYTLTWLFIVVWVLLVVTTVYENKSGLAGGYFVFFYFVGVFLATWISYLELFSLPRKSDYVSQFRQTSRRASSFGSRLLTPTADEIGSTANAEEEPTESTSLLRGGGQRMTFAHYTRVEDDNHTTSDLTVQEHDRGPAVYGHEQQWSAKLPKWTWVLQLLLLAPIVIILVGQIGLFLTSALHQTGQDGSSVLTVYLLIVACAVLILVPILPFIHRYTYHIPVFLLLIFIGTLIYNLVAFPFSPTNRLKLFFIQEVDLDTGVNRASLTGIPPFVNDAVNAVPSAAGQNITCDWLGPRLKCSWEGLPPHVTSTELSSLSTGSESDWVSFNVSKTSAKRATFDISGKNTRACKILFDSPVSDFNVAGSALDDRFPHISHHGTKEIRLWSRTWDRTWTVDVRWPKGDLSGRVVCLWSDHNRPGLIPALDEVQQYIPDWAAISKLSDGLVEGSKSFKV
ncbi:putative zinc metalloprotease [Paecilomyces variotii]|uniref:Peptide hydrolase n=1 Tax=Byssochlamys spectabilis TaxID=264951 RepID=A0A443HQW2_BYSSP|nr:putative zinc metalloprotease [Paecilomyces variotii]KAJ9354149.1 hypothetical protein DTO280E4_7031 [Paecilomyces variotii]RWQ94181.1 putative zinc metalloprotease [Paecilomyces variotii]